MKSAAETKPKYKSGRLVANIWEDVSKDRSQKKHCFGRGSQDPLNLGPKGRQLCHWKQALGRELWSSRSFSLISAS